MSNSNKEHLERIADSIKSSNLSDNEKANSVKIIEEWIAEDKSFGILYEKLAEVSENVEAFIAELGLI